MKKIIRDTSQDGIVQITIADERWYVKDIFNDKGEKIDTKFVPSVTWICGHYPKGTPFYKWLANNGWDESEAIKQAAGDKGSKIHAAIVELIDGNEVQMDSKFMNPSSEKEEELTLEEYEALMHFKNWYEAVRPKIIRREFVIWNDEENYGGTVDLLCEIEGKTWIIDFKTGQNVWPEYELQVSAYKRAYVNTLKDPLTAEVNLGILQIGYRRNKNGWKFTEVEDKYQLFMAARQIWDNEVSQKEPKAKDYPLSLKLESYGDQQKVGAEGGNSPETAPRN